MKKSICVLAALLICALSILTGMAEDSGAAVALNPPVTGEQEITLVLSAALEDLRAELRSGEEGLLAAAEVEGDRLRLTLNRPLRTGEALTLRLSGLDDAGNAVELTCSLLVESAFQRKLPDLTRKAEEFQQVWTESWLPATEAGEIWIPAAWRGVPFALWADEAPEIRVLPLEMESLIYLSEALPSDWRVAVGSGMPVVYTACAWDETLGAWTADSGFDSVYLIHEMTEIGVSLSIEYSRANSFRASCPVAEWIREEGEPLTAFNCYGWGTSRSFQGGMLAIVTGENAVYAEYNAEGALVSYTMPEMDCVFDPAGNMLEGTLPEGYENPVVIR